MILKDKAFLIGIYFFILTLTGCSMITHHDELMRLKRLGDNQKQMQRYIKQQEKFFYKLRRDVKRNRLRKGTSKEKILVRYGEPILTKPIEDKADIKEIFLYRHPTEYFSTDLIYLYFDEGQCLSFWELKLAEN